MINFKENIDKESAFRSVQEYLTSKNLSIQAKDRERPWGGFFVIDETSLETFIDQFFPSSDPRNNSLDQVLSPKILLVQPDKRLSWQYHYRRAELWKIINGPVGIILSDDDNQTELQKFNSDELIKIDCGERHRLVGLEEWGVVAEIWQHTDPSNPSDENDIVRLEDDYGR